MGRAFRAELLKIRTTRMAAGLLALTLGYTAVQLAALIAFAGEQGIPPLTDPRTVDLLYALPAGSVIFAMILGITGISGEYRYLTISSTLLAEPRRGRVVAAKLAAYTLAGLGYGLAAAAMAATVTTIALAADGTAGPVAGDRLLSIAAGVVVAYALYGLAGVGVGALLRNQVAAIVTAIGWVLVADTVINLALPGLGAWLPGGAVNALTGAAGDIGGGPRAETLPPWGGALLLFGYGLAFAVAAAVTSSRRDIT
jgi:ABC-2 type transport system permease protein